MSVVAILSNHFKYQLGVGAVILTSDSIKVLLMRSGFVFSEDEHATLSNLKADSTAITINVDDSAGTFTRTTGSFLTNGFVPGNSITGSGFANGGNNATFIIDTVTALVITVVTKTGMVTESGGGDERLIADDELATAHGYTQNTKTTGTVTGVESDANNRGEFTFPTVTWSASGGDIGPTPGAIIYDDTTSDNTIIGYFDLGGEQTATTGEPFSIGNGSIYIA